MAKKKRKPDSTLHLAINGRTLDGEKHGVTWFFTCPDFPDLAKEYTGAKSQYEIISVFTRLALYGGIYIKKLESKK